MARTDATDSRGQLLIIAGLLLAVLFAGLAIVVNGAIYAENLSTRESTSSAAPLAADPVTEQHMSEVMARANYYSETATYEERMSVLENNVTDWGTYQSEWAAESGRARSAELGGSEEGTRVTQASSGEFMPANENLVDVIIGETLDPLGLTGRTSWVTALDVNSRAFQATVQKDSLKDINDTDLNDVVQWILDGNNPFGVVFEDTDSGTLWSVYLVDLDDGNGDTEVTAVVTENDGSEDVIGTCRVEGSTATLQLGTNELVSDQERTSCPELSFTEDLDRHNIYFTGGTNAKGTYRFIVDKEEETFNNQIDDEYANLVDSLLGLVDCVLNPLDPLCLLEDNDPDVYGDDPGTEPYTTEAIYSVSVEQTYVDDRVTYTRNQTIAPPAR